MSREKLMWSSAQRTELYSPDKGVSLDVGADHLHAAGVDQGLDAALFTGFDHILRP